METLAKLRPAFKEGGTVTAGNSSGINDGASAVVLMSLEKAEELELKPMATIVAGASAGVEPQSWALVLPLPRKSPEIAQMDLSQIELIEANEAFASQTVAVAKMLDFNTDIVNVNGGAIALGHPVGASGCRILTTLLYEMEKRDLTYGLATLCVGGGMGVATIMERCDNSCQFGTPECDLKYRCNENQILLHSL